MGGRTIGHLDRHLIGMVGIRIGRVFVIGALLKLRAPEDAFNSNRAPSGPDDGMENVPVRIARSEIGTKVWFSGASAMP